MVPSRDSSHFWPHYGLWNNQWWVKSKILNSGSNKLWLGPEALLTCLEWRPNTWSINNPIICSILKQGLCFFQCIDFLVLNSCAKLFYYDMIKSISMTDRTQTSPGHLKEVAYYLGRFKKINKIKMCHVYLPRCPKWVSHLFFLASVLPRKALTIPLDTTLQNKIISSFSVVLAPNQLSLIMPHSTICMLLFFFKHF